MLVGELGLRLALARSENPRVGGSIPPLATIKIRVYSGHTGVLFQLFSSREPVDRVQGPGSRLVRRYFREVGLRSARQNKSMYELDGLGQLSFSTS
jgi:hypothetical protein